MIRMPSNIFPLIISRRTTLRLMGLRAVSAVIPAVVNGCGTTYKEPQDHGFMYGHGFQDLDGHIWELVYMEPVASD